MSAVAVRDQAAQNAAKIASQPMSKGVSSLPPNPPDSHRTISLSAKGNMGAKITAIASACSSRNWESRGMWYATQES
jgi:hypothetical protein